MGMRGKCLACFMADNDVIKLAAADKPRGASFEVKVGLASLFLLLISLGAFTALLAVWK
jgi:hypothetical protein